MQAEQALPSDLVAGLMAELTTLEQEQPEQVIVYPATRERPLLWALVLLSLVMVAAVASWGRGKARVQQAAEAERDLAGLQSQRVLEDYRRLQQLVDDLTSPRVDIVQLRPASGDEGGAEARVFVNLSQRRITLRAVGLEAAGDEQVYVVWWRGPTKEQLVGVIPGSAAARGASVRLDLPETTELPAQLLVSLETRPGARPASRGGPVVLEGVLGVPASGSRVPRESEELP